MSSPDRTPTEQSPLLETSSTSSTLTGVSDRDRFAQDDGALISRSRGVLIGISIFILVFILTSNVSLLSTIQSPIAAELGASSSVSWFTSAYMISATSLMPIAGRLSQIFTARVYLFVSIIIQCLGLLVTAVSSSVWMFLAGRVVTGVGTAAVTPVAFILVNDLAGAKHRGLLFGLINTGYTSGVALGAIIAGALEPVVGWRWVFGVQAPVSFAAALIAFLAIPKPGRAIQKGLEDLSLGQKLSRIDYMGTVTLITSVVLLLYSLSSPTIQYTPVVLSVLSFVLFLYTERHWAHSPIVPISLLKSRANLFTGLSTVGLMSARWGILFYAPMYALSVLGWTQAQSGLLLLPTNAGFALGGVLAGALHIRKAQSYYVACLACYLLFALSLFTVSRITTTAPNIPAYIVGLFLNGLITGALLNYSLAHVLYLNRPASHLIVIPLNAVFRGLSGSFGSSIFGGFFIRRLAATLTSSFADRGLLDNRHRDLIRKLLGTPALVQKLEGVDREVAVAGYQTSMRALFLAGSVVALVTMVIQAGTGWTAPEPVDEEDALENEALSPVVSREVVES